MADLNLDTVRINAERVRAYYVSDGGLTLRMVQHFDKHVPALLAEVHRLRESEALGLVTALAQLEAARADNARLNTLVDDMSDDMINLDRDVHADLAEQLDEARAEIDRLRAVPEVGCMTEAVADA